MDGRNKKTAWAGAILAGAAMLTLAGAEARAAVVFEDSFTGSPTGGTRALINANNATATISSTPPTIDGSDYLNASVAGATGASFNRAVLNYTPTDASSSWNALVGSSLVIGPTTFLNVNGGFDIFVRPNVIAPTNLAAWFRPVDVDNRAAGGARIIFNQAAAGRFAIAFVSTATNFDLVPTAGTAFTAFDSTGVNTTMPSVGAVTPTAGNTYHLGFTLVTDQSTGLITYSIFGKLGTDAIDTTSATDRLFQQFFYGNGDALSGTGTHPVLSTATWLWNQSSGTTPFPDANVDYDTYRIHSGTVTSFAAVVPEPASLGLLSLGGLALLRRRRA